MNTKHINKAAKFLGVHNLMTTDENLMLNILKPVPNRSLRELH